MHVKLLIAAHRMRFLGLAAFLEHTIANVQHRSVWPRLILADAYLMKTKRYKYNWPDQTIENHCEKLLDIDRDSWYM